MLLRVIHVTEDIDVFDGNTDEVFFSVLAGERYQGFYSKKQIELMEPCLKALKRMGKCTYHINEKYVFPRDPGNGDNFSTKYIREGSFWLNSVTNRLFICITEGGPSDMGRRRSLLPTDAVWQNIPMTLSGTENPNQSVEGHYGDHYHNTATDAVFFCKSEPKGRQWIKLT